MAIKCILAMVKPDLTDKVVSAAKKAGARGATIISGTGTGRGEAKTFFGLSLEERTDIVLFVVAQDILDAVLDAVGAAGRFKEPGTGIACVFPVEQVRGLESQLQDMPGRN